MWPLNEERTVNLSKRKNNAESIIQNYNFVQKKRESLVNFPGLFGWLNQWQENGLNPGVTYLDWKRSSWWLEFWIGLLFVTDVSTTYAEAIFKVKSSRYKYRLSRCFKQTRMSRGSNWYELITKLHKIKIQMPLDAISITTEFIATFAREKEMQGE